MLCEHSLFVYNSVGLQLKRVSSLTGSSVYPSRFAIILKGNFIMANNVCGELGLRLQRQKGMLVGGAADEGKGVELLTSQLLLLLGLPDSGFNKTDPNFPAMFAVLRRKGAPYKKIEITEHILFYSRHSFYKIKPPKFNFRWGTCDFPLSRLNIKS